MMYRKIMVPVDESAAAKRALQEAIMLAKLCHSVIRVVNVVDLAQFSWGGVGAMPSEEVRKAVNAAGEKGVREAQALLEQSSLQYEIAVIESAGDKIADLLIREATEHHVDLVVMGTHGFSGFMHVLMGSVAEGVLRQSDIPVMLLRVREDN
ncbi:universal stress protein [Snodgrassella sp. B3882]|uniref:universal stress protein n=1 Tax=Snodgrassella sp. B3882 TaxID=2818037 RepID=UPI00226A7C83|nr:universal stress protein [Snodgrassella sp. B3882]MCX8745724.1 universal stress protein [Snodgrassella sp. B3882]